MESKKNNNQGSVIKSFLLMTVVLAFIGGFALSSDLKSLLDSSTKDTKEESGEILTAGVKGNKTLGFDERYVESNGDYEYNIDFGTYAGSTDVYFTLNYGNSRKEIKVSWYNYDNEDVQEYSLDFVSNVVDVFLGQFDNAPENNTIFFLLENGDVCYSFVEDMVKKDTYGVYSTIGDIMNAVKFYKGNAGNDETGLCVSTTYVQEKNGKIIDLSQYVIG